MKVLLIADVKDLGKTGEIHTVADGYARNYLIPHRLAVTATEQNIAQANQQRAAEQRRAEKQANQAQDLAKRIDGTEVRFPAHVGEQDRLYGSITSADIADELARKIGQQIDRHHIELVEPIRELGTFEVPIRLGKGAIAKVTVIVERG
ncbi:MAG: 50S ribosomal protein L9 [Chloroflexi bacterium]|nr:50S ribosomal protein L9 [Chloroflexota bacterium]MCL5110321.1 50S ribosomal protein L9 [Chloroflexota bacterium]